MGPRKSTPSTAAMRPVLAQYDKSKEGGNELFVDLVEQLTVLISAAVISNSVLLANTHS